MSATPEPKAYLWLANDGNEEVTLDEHCPYEPDKWSSAVALYSFDQLEAVRCDCGKKS